MSTPFRRAAGLLSGFACLLGSARASAQFDLGAYARRAQGASLASASSLPSVFARGRKGTVPLIVRSPSGPASAPELVSVGDFAVGRLDPARVLELTMEHPDWSFDWAPPRHALMDRVDGWVHAASVRRETHTSGQGVVVGIVDTGVDLTHPDLQTADHKTRVAWLLDVARDPAKLHPELEAEYGCTLAGAGCAIYAASDLDHLLAGASDLPTDPFGHGTHVASLAAGNGLASPTPRYLGIAPEATYVIARVASATGSIEDADVLRAVKFVFDRAEALGMPAVVNLSLGSDFGAHDGSSALEAGLSSLVGPAFPGRAIVVAAGNSAGLYDGLKNQYPGPFGIHTEVHVPRESASRVPLLTPALAGTVTRGTAYVWLQFRDGDEIAVGLDDKNGTRVPPVPSGAGYTNDPADAAVKPNVGITIVNGIKNGSATGGANPGQNGAIVTIDGAWPADTDFVIRLEGHGSAQLWVQGLGDLDAELNLGALFPRGEKQGTINVPASAPGLIAVGATLNRNAWTDYAGTAIEMPNLGATDNAPLDTIAYFSSAGPNALGVIKPDIVAPGVWVAGAMAQAADPRSTSNAFFANQGRCPSDVEECFVVDEKHAIAAGTSMSAPVVSGAIALLFERDPTLTQDAARAILQAGARPLQGIILDARQIGPGALDLEGALSVASAGESPALRVPSSHSWLTLSESYAHPDPTWPVNGFLDLRDAAGEVADGFDQSRLSLSVQNATLSEPLTRVASGFYRFAVSAPAGSGGQTLHLSLSFDRQLILEKELPIAVDRWVAEGGVSARGGCAIGALPLRFAWGGWAALGGACALLRRRRHMRAK